MAESLLGVSVLTVVSGCVSEGVWQLSKALRHKYPLRVAFGHLASNLRTRIPTDFNYEVLEGPCNDVVESVLPKSFKEKHPVLFGAMYGTVLEVVAGVSILPFTPSPKAGSRISVWARSLPMGLPLGISWYAIKQLLAKHPIHEKYLYKNLPMPVGGPIKSACHAVAAVTLATPAFCAVTAYNKPNDKKIRFKDCPTMTVIRRLPFRLALDHCLYRIGDIGVARFRSWKKLKK